jgi:hypothetical protein
MSGKQTDILIQDLYDDAERTRLSELVAVWADGEPAAVAELLRAVDGVVAVRYSAALSNYWAVQIDPRYNREAVKFQLGDALRRGQVWR